MMQLIKTRETLVWLFLMVLSALTWVLGAHHQMLSDDRRVEIVALLSIAFFKVWLVIQHFMEVRHAPMMLKLSCGGWLLLTFGTVVSLCCGWV